MCKVCAAFPALKMADGPADREDQGPSDGKKRPVTNAARVRLVWKGEQRVRRTDAKNTSYEGNWCHASLHDNHRRRTCLFALTSASFAGNKNNKENNREKKSQNHQKFALKGSMPGQMLRQSQLSGRGNNSSQRHAKHDTRKTHNKQDDNINNIIPLDPGRGDGRVPVAPVISTPPARPGFVWKGDHLERARATARPNGPPPVANGGGGVTVTTANSGPVIRDHRQGVVTVTPVPTRPPFVTQLNNPPPVVLNPATKPSTPPRGSSGRPRFDHNRAPGGVTVSVVPGSQRPQNVTGVGGSRIDGAIDAVTDIFRVNVGITPAGKRDHRR